MGSGKKLEGDGRTRNKCEGKQENDKMKRGNLLQTIDQV